MRLNISDRHGIVFQEALRALNKADITYVVGGAFAMYHYTGKWRDTNDLDVYLERSCVRPAVDALSGAGFRDYGEMAVGDREWIYHAVRDSTFVDLIWQPPNHLLPVDASFFDRGEDGTFLQVPVRFMPPEELVWAKIFTMNHQRCDWPDVFQMVRATRGRLDWPYLINRMAEHWPVLLSFVVLFDWVYPGEADAIPDLIRKELIQRKMTHPPSPEEPTREVILDPWVYTRPVP